jgi:low affinity Fe/Cu permease
MILHEGFPLSGQACVVAGTRAQPRPRESGSPFPFTAWRSGDVSRNLSPVLLDEILPGVGLSEERCHVFGVEPNVRKLAHHFRAWSSRPSAFLIVVVYAALWFIFERESFDWHGVATLATLTMTLFIQRAEHRDTQAIHAKLDELLHVHNRASNELTRIDDQEPEEIERHRREARSAD